MLGLLVLLAAGCGDDGDPTGADDGSGDVAAALADVARIDDGVAVRIGTADFSSVGAEVQPVALGDAVRTDGSGYAEVRYFDGSLTRLDVDTEFTVIELVDGPGAATIRTEMGFGRTWHRVAELTGNGVYEVETSVATATVRGTAFTVTCPEVDRCTFAVHEGAVEITVPGGDAITLAAGEEITIVADEPPPPPTPLAGDPLAGDAWLADNTERDLDAGFAPVGRDGPTPPGPEDGPAGPDDGSALPPLPGAPCDVFDASRIQAELGIGQAMSSRGDGPTCRYEYGFEGLIEAAPDRLAQARVSITINDLPSAEFAAAGADREEPISGLGDVAGITRPRVNPSGTRQPNVMISVACSARRFDAFTFVSYFVEGDPLAESVADEAAMESTARALATDFVDRYC